MSEKGIDTLLNAGDFIRSAWVGPHLTPYGKRIADHYRVQVPWYLTVSSGLGTPPSRRTVVTRPYQHDVLIMGASALVTGANPDNGNFIYLQITHNETGLTWATPNVVNSAPLPAYAGINNNVMPIMALPEAFFLPKGTQLQLDWSAVAAVATNSNARLTFVGVQLINPINGHAPKHITMPDGKIIEVGSRLPWFGTTGIGFRANSFALQGVGFFLRSGEQTAQFLVPADCDIELHDLYANFLSGFAGSTQTAELVVKIVDMGTATNWNPAKSPVGSIFGSELQVNPALPFTKPYLLRKNHRINILAQLNFNTGLETMENGLLTLRGVRLCEF